jgi:hypothetical protein
MQPRSLYCPPGSIFLFRKKLLLLRRARRRRHSERVLPVILSVERSPEGRVSHLRKGYGVFFI